MRFPQPPYSEKLIQNTIEFWEPKYGHKLTKDDAEEILTNLFGYFNILMEIDENSKMKESCLPSGDSSDS